MHYALVDTFQTSNPGTRCNRKYPDAKGIRDQLLSPSLILMLLLLAEVLLPINSFCKFLQTRNLIYCLVTGKDLLIFSKDATSVGRELRSSERINGDTDISGKKLTV